MPFGGWSIISEVFEKIKELVPSGSTILELGSGIGTEELAKEFRVFSIEHNKKYVDKVAGATYIHATLKTYTMSDGKKYKWYDDEMVVDGLAGVDYRLILIDGPPGNVGRVGFLHNLGLFNPDVPMIFDDAHRPAELRLAKEVSEAVDRPFEVFEGHHGKKLKKHAVIGGNHE